MGLIVFLVRVLVTVHINETIVQSDIGYTALELQSPERKAELHYKQTVWNANIGIKQTCRMNIEAILSQRTRREGQKQIQIINLCSYVKK